MAKLNGHLFARLALDYFDHPKIAALSPEAIVAHLEMIVYARRYGTDGRIPNRIANRFGSGSLTELANNDPDRPSIAIHDDGSVTVHDYSEYQETREQIEARRQVNAANGRKGGRPGKRTANRTGTQPVNGSGSETKAETETETEVPSTKERPDVEHVCTMFADLCQSTATNGKRPTITQAWRDAARRLIDLDGRTVDDIERITRWALADDFWVSNVRSLPKLREKFETLTQQAQRPTRQQQARPNRDAASTRGLVQAHEDLFGRTT